MTLALGIGILIGPLITCLGTLYLHSALRRARAQSDHVLAMEEKRRFIPPPPALRVRPPRLPWAISGRAGGTGPGTAATAKLTPELPLTSPQQRDYLSR